MRIISFITANYVARVNAYNGVEDWGSHDRATIKAASEELWGSILAEVKSAGFKAVDLWTALCNWTSHTPEFASRIRALSQQQGMKITSYVGGLVVNTPAEVDKAFAFMQQTGAPIWAGGMWGAEAAKMAPVVHDVCEKYDTWWALENHPEKTPQEILAKIDGGKHQRVGVALDTGWCGTQGMDALEAVKRLREHLLILHLKDVKSVGRHDTCALGEGIVPVEKVVRHLVESDWQGTIGIEHEPYDRAPMPEIRRSLQRLEGWLR